MTDTIKIDRKGTRLIAHRGLSGIERENTLAAFIAAGNRDYFGIETDVHITADKKHIIIHDDETGRIALKNLPVEKTCFDELQDVAVCDTDGKVRSDLRLPSLDEYLKICSRYGKTGVLELKNPMKREDICGVAEAVKKAYDIKKMIYISFDYNNLVVLRELLPQAHIQWLCACDVDEALCERLNEYGFGVDIAYSFLNEAAVKLLHTHGIEVNCWTCDSDEDANRLIAWGVDYITTNILQHGI